jgi:hypothetical protein
MSQTICRPTWWKWCQQNIQLLLESFLVRGNIHGGKKTLSRQVRFHVLTTASIKMAVFRVNRYRVCWKILTFQGACCLHFHRSYDGWRKHLWNVCSLLPDYTAEQPRRQPFLKVSNDLVPSLRPSARLDSTWKGHKRLCSTSVCST